MDIENRLTEIEAAQESDPRRVTTLMFRFKKHLLQAAGEGVRGERDFSLEEVFRNRERVLDVYRKLGEGRHDDIIGILEGLERPLDLMQHLPKPSPKDERKAQEKKERKGHKRGFYVFGGDLGDDQVKAVRKASKTGLKVGDPTYINLTDLFSLKSNLSTSFHRRVMSDNRPIYINAPIDATLLKQLQILVHLREGVEERISFMTWDEEENLRIIPYKDTLTQLALPPAEMDENYAPLVTLSQDLTEVEREAAEQIDDIINHEPEEGDIYTGRITKVCDFGVFVQIQHGIEGLLFWKEVAIEGDYEWHDGASRFADDRWRWRKDIIEGNKLTVEILEIEKVSGKMRLSEKAANKTIAEGQDPRLQRMAVLSGNPVLAGMMQAALPTSRSE